MLSAEVEMVAWAAFGFFHRGSLTVLRDARRRRLSMTAGSTRSVGDGRMVDIEVHGVRFARLCEPAALAPPQRQSIF